MPDTAPDSTFPQPVAPAGESDCPRRFLLNLFANLAGLRESLAGLYGPAGLSEHTLIVLESLAAQHPEALLPSRLAQQARITRSAMTQLLDRLEQRGWLKRRRDPADRRIIRIQLTDEGRRVTAALSAHFDAVCQELFREVDAHELARLDAFGAAVARAARTLQQHIPVFQSAPP